MCFHVKIKQGLIVLNCKHNPIIINNRIERMDAKRLSVSQPIAAFALLISITQYTNPVMLSVMQMSFGKPMPGQLQR